MDLTFTKEEIKETVQDVWTAFSDKKVWAFYGEMGSGKTTFIRALCAFLGVISTVASPTYAIIHEYSTAERGSLIHMDWYRLKDEEEAINAGVEEALYSNKICFVEWPEKAEALLPEHTLHVQLEVVNSGTRRIKTHISDSVR